jgi:uncharacterized protein (TIGR02231 family)
MNARFWLLFAAALGSGARAQEAAPREPVAPRSAPSRVSAVTVYQGSAMVTREVTVPANQGLVELVVTPLPPAVVANSLSAEAGEGIRVLSTRYRSRAVRDDSRAAVRAVEEEIRTLALEAERVKREAATLQKNIDFLQKLEDFTAATMKGLADQGMLDGEATIKLGTFVMESRTSKSVELVADEQKLKANADATTFAQQRLQELSAGSSRIESDAIIVIDKANALAATVRLNYLVGTSTWKPLYRLRAGGEKDPVQLESLAAIEQQSGEDWTDATVTLSTAQPGLDAIIPDLLPLDIRIAETGETPTPGQAAFGVGGPAIETNRAIAKQFRGQAQTAMASADRKQGTALLNEAAALDQAEELLADQNERAKAGLDTGLGGGPSVTVRLANRLNVPSRQEPQLVEVSRIAMAPEYFAKAVPVLSPRVYRMAKLTNTGDALLLPGEATMYVGSDFVGRMSLPQVAVGEQFTVGFGIDPQLQVGRRLVKKTQIMQGGNQVQTFEFRIVLRNYKATDAVVQVWDRLPKADPKDVVVGLGETRPEPSTDPLYVRNQRPDNLLRWDVIVPARTTGEKVFPITYQFKLEYAKEMAIDYLGSRGLMEGAIGGMGGMGGGFR